MSYLYTFGEVSNQELYEELVDYMSKHGFAPTHRELAESLHTNNYVVRKHLDELVSRGFIKREKGKPRAIKLCKYKLVEIG